ncbi:MAG TPA: right-handed parallel beta-helix repeat-containing protein [Allosphingosinicella sp.]|nr:right-handed parallel beta-helix repeat-containing protein [Allosphingosinicella sp.]
MTFIRKLAPLAAAAIFGTTMFAATPANAQATRTWVSGVGDDVNPCSRTAPCKTFAGAISKTAAGGEINCLDPGGFGAVTITKSMTISCPYTEGGALAGGNGITVNLPASTDVVFIRGLDIFGVNPPSNGVRIIGQGTVHIEDTVIRRFNAASSVGISAAPTGPLKLYVSNTTVAENGTVASGAGISLKPGVGGSIQADLKGVRVRDNPRDGFIADSTNGQVSFVISNSEFSGSQQGLVAVAGVSVMRGMITDSTVTHNSVVGIGTAGSNTVLRVDSTTITGNTQGINVGASSQILSYGGNRLDGNPTSGAPNDGTFTGIVIPRK